MEERHGEEGPAAEDRREGRAGGNGATRAGPSGSAGRSETRGREGRRPAGMRSAPRARASASSRSSGACGLGELVLARAATRKGRGEEGRRQRVASAGRERAGRRGGRHGPDGLLEPGLGAPAGGVDADLGCSVRAGVAVGERVGPVEECSVGVGVGARAHRRRLVGDERVVAFPASFGCRMSERSWQGLANSRASQGFEVRLARVLESARVALARQLLRSCERHGADGTATNCVISEGFRRQLCQLRQGCTLWSQSRD